MLILRSPVVVVDDEMLVRRRGAGTGLLALWLELQRRSGFGGLLRGVRHFVDDQPRIGPPLGAKEHIMAIGEAPGAVAVAQFGGLRVGVHADTTEVSRTGADPAGQRALTRALRLPLLRGGRSPAGRGHARGGKEIAPGHHFFFSLGAVVSSTSRSVAFFSRASDLVLL